MIEEVKSNENSYLASGFDEYYNKIQITSKTQLTKDSWITIPHFIPQMDKNYAEI